MICREIPGKRGGGSALNRNAGKRHHRHAPDRLPEDPCRLKDTEQEKILHLRPRTRRVWAGDDPVVVDAARVVYISLDDDLARAPINRLDGILAMACGVLRLAKARL